MKERLDYTAIGQRGLEGLRKLEGYVRMTGLESSMLELVRLRASQLNGCAYCVDMHTKDARAGGETEQRLYAVSVWRDAPFFTDRERAALAWTEAVTLVHDTHVPDEAFALVRQYFGDKEIVDLTYAIVAINAWNRLAVSFRRTVGTYQPDRRAHEAPGPEAHERGLDTGTP